MKRRRVVSLLAVAAFIFAFASAALAQNTGGSVTGVVLDTTGAAVPNATVSLRSRATGQVLNSQSTGSGSFTFPNVPGGDYTLTVESSGFQTVTQEIRVVLNQQTSANITLGAAEVSGGVVDVTAASEALVQTDSSQLGRSFETRQVLDLPIFGNQNRLALLAPNVVLQSSGTAGQGGSVGGTRPRSNSFNIDGVDNNQFSVTGAQTRVIQDAVAEFTLLSNNYNAEFGTAGGGIFNTTTRSGTNEFHGSAFVYFQHQGLNAASTQEERQLLAGTITELPRFYNSRYGGTLGGPIVRNQLFFFAAAERNPTSQASSGSGFLAPTAAGLAQIGTLPQASPLMVGILRDNLLLAPAQTTTRTVFGQPIPFGTVSVISSGVANDDAYQINLDHLRGTSDQFRYRYSFNRVRQENTQVGGGGGLGNPKFNSLFSFDSHIFSSTWIHTFSSSVVNDLRLSYRRVLSNTPLVNSEFNTFPNFTISELNLSLGPQSNLPQSSFNNNYQVFDALTYIRGNHTFKLGGEFRRLIATSNFLPRARGDYLYDTFERYLQDLVPTTAIRGVGSGGYTFNQSQFFAFVQDDWKLTPNLTLNLGLRYEYQGLFRDQQLEALNAIANVPGVLEFRVPQTDRNNFAPRVGFAYSPDFETGFWNTLFGRRGASSIRANFAVSYSQQFGNLPLLLLPPQFQQELRPGDIAGFNLGPGFIQRGGLPATPNPPTTPAAARASTTSFTPHQIVSPYTYSYTLSFQRELSPTMALELRYLGTRSYDLPVQVQINAPLIRADQLIIPTFLSGGAPTAAQLQGLPALSSITGGAAISAIPRRLAGSGFTGNITSYQYLGSSQYDGGSVSLTRRFSQGLAFTAAYTFSKSIDDSTNEVFSSAVNPRRPQDFDNLRDERSVSVLDIPHRFAASVVYEVPWFNSSSNAFVRGFFGGWQINAIYQAQSGQPATPQSVIDSNLNRDSFAGDRTILNPAGAPGTGSGVTAYALVDGVVTQVPLGDLRTQAYVANNPNAQYIQAGYGARATAGRNTLRTNGFHRTDMVFLKNFRFGEERYNLQLGVEAVNFFNQRIRTVGNFAAILPTVGGLSPTDFSFMNVAGATFNDYSIGNYSGRTLQLRAKFIF